MDFQTAKVKIKAFQQHDSKRKYWVYLKLLKHVNVAPLDRLQHHVIKVDNAFVSQVLLALNVLIVRQAFMDFPTAKVKIRPFQ